MTKKEERERRARLDSESEIKRNNLAAFWINFTKFFRPWLYELTERYKARGEFPVMACWLLPSYYTDPLDIEVAAWASLLVREDEKLLQRVSAYRELLGEHPHDWFINRGFVSLSIGKTRDSRTGGVSNYCVASYFSELYENWNRRERCVESILLKYFGEDRYIERSRTLRFVLSGSDGFSFGVWPNEPQAVRCPIRTVVKDFLKTFMPDYVRYHDTDMALSIFGFEKDSDFFYAALAYEELRHINPSGCSRLSTLFQKRYSEGNILTGKYWTSSYSGILPEIPF